MAPGPGGRVGGVGEIRGRPVVGALAWRFRAPLAAATDAAALLPRFLTRAVASGGGRTGSAMVSHMCENMCETTVCNMYGNCENMNSCMPVATASNTWLQWSATRQTRECQDGSLVIMVHNSKRVTISQCFGETKRDYRAISGTLLPVGGYLNLPFAMQ